MTERTEWPTPERLLILRESGLVPYSPLTTRCGAAFAVIVTLFATRDTMGRWVAILKTVVTGYPSLNPSTVKRLLQLTVEIGLSSILAAIVGTVITGLLQTKFLVRGGVKLELRRAMNTEPLSLAFIIRSIFGGLLTLGATWGLAALLLYAGVQLSGGSLILREEELVRAPYGVFERAMPFVLAGLGSLGAMAYLLSKLRFMLRHRMTRQELTKSSEEAG